ncbi:MAG: MOSC N-terminal beta barrel domain-containing protein [Spirulinaceae cyanobacterium]
MTITVSQIWIYPLKSCRGIPLNQAEVTPKGFKWDREFMFVDENGQFLTQRKYPDLARIKVEIADNALSLTAEDSNLETIQLQPTLEGKEIPVTVWRSHVTAIDQGNKVADWLQKFLHETRNFRLVRQSPQYPRSVNPQYAIAEDNTVSFADGYPFLLTATASLAELNKRIKEHYQNEKQQVLMQRFRPNLVIKTEEAFWEEKYQNMQIGEVTFALVKSCDRCIITTTDQITGKRNEQQEPLRTLGTFRKFPSQGILFGENLIPHNIGTIKVGERVTFMNASC